MTISIVFSKFLPLLAPLFSNVSMVQLIIAASCALSTMLSLALLRWSTSLPKLTHRLLLLMTLSLTLFYNVVVPPLLQPITKAVPIVWAMFTGSRFPSPSQAVSSSLWDTNFKKEGIMTMPSMKELKNKRTIKQY